MNLLRIVPILLVLVTISGVGYVYADSHNLPPISVSSDLTIYSNGNDVVVSGNIKNYDSALHSGQDLTVIVITPEDDLATISQVSPNSDGSFQFNFKAGGPLWEISGDYIVDVHFAGNSGETTINYVGGEQVITGPKPEPEPEPTTERTPYLPTTERTPYLPTTTNPPMDQDDNSDTKGKAIRKLIIENRDLKNQVTELKIENRQMKNQINLLNDQIDSMTKEFVYALSQLHEWFGSQINK